MNGSGVLIDSVILIDHLNGIGAATRYLQQVGRAAHVSVITRAEVLAGLAPGARRAAVPFLDWFRFLALDREIADLAAELRSLHGWKFPDALQAAAAKRHDLLLATRDAADFDPGRFSFVIIPYSL